MCSEEYLWKFIIKKNNSTEGGIKLGLDDNNVFEHKFQPHSYYCPIFVIFAFIALICV